MIKDSGERTKFETGAVRDMKIGKGRMDLLPWYGIMEVSKHCEEGAEKYGEHNIDKGIPLHSLCDSAARHLAKFIAGEIDEDHLRASAWNLLWALNQRTTHPELDDLYSHKEKIEKVRKAKAKGELVFEDGPNEIDEECSGDISAEPSAIEPLSNSLTDWVNALVTMKMAERMLAERPGMADYIRSLEPEDASKYENTPWYGYMSARNRNLSLLDSLLSPSWRRSFEEEAVGKIGEYRYPDGAFSWFPGGRHSVYMTLAFLERYAVAEDFGIGHSGKEAGYISGAIDYLDKEFSSHLENMSDSLGWRRYRKLRFDSDAFVHDYMFVRSFYINSVALSGDAARFYRKCEKLMAKRATFADVPLKIKYARVLLNGDRYASSRRIADIVASLYEYAQEDRWGNLCFGAGIHGPYGIFDSEIYVNSSALMLFDHLDKAGFEDRKGTAGKVSVLLSGIERHLLSLKESSDWGDGFRASVAVAALISRSSGDFPAKACHIVTDADGLASMTDGGFLEIPASEGRDLKIVSVSKVYHTIR